MTSPRVLISDKLSEAALTVFAERGIVADFRPELGGEAATLRSAISGYDGLAIRSATKADAGLIAAAPKLRVIGRAGIGVDNVDVEAASARGIVVMNTPFGNATTTAEHAIAMMLALARAIPAADASTRAGRWEKSKFTGVELTAKVLGLIGCGNIGAIVADRARGLKMKVIAHDPFLAPERAAELGVERVDLDALLARADFVSIHAPLTDKTRNMLSAEALAAMKPGARLINCARGGLVDEAALAHALASGHIAGAAFDVFSEEPARDNPLFGAPNFIATPHLGAATAEAQETVALQIAEQMSNFLRDGAVANAINMPSISADEAPVLKPWARLAEQLGLFAGQLTETGVRRATIEYAGPVAELNLKALTAAALTGLLKPHLAEVNMVSAPLHARARGVECVEIRREARGAFESYVNLIVKTETQTRNVAGTVFSDGAPRLIQVKGVEMEARLGRFMLYTTNADRPGFIGALGMALGAAGVNIARFSLGRAERGGEAIALVEVDEPLSEPVLESLRALPHVRKAQALRF